MQNLKIGIFRGVGEVEALEALGALGVLGALEPLGALGVLGVIGLSYQVLSSTVGANPIKHRRCDSYQVLSTLRPLVTSYKLHELQGCVPV